MSTNKSVETMNRVPDVKLAEAAQRRRPIRYLAAAFSAATALMYFMIAFRVVTVIEGSADSTWALFPCAAYTLGAVLLLVYDHREVWILGAALQVFVIFTYFDLAAQRTPAFEIWGILIRIAQFIILFALAYLVYRESKTSAKTGTVNALDISQWTK
jgi:hypothetical protein